MDSPPNQRYLVFYPHLFLYESVEHINSQLFPGFSLHEHQIKAIQKDIHDNGYNDDDHRYIVMNDGRVYPCTYTKLLEYEKEQGEKDC